MDTPSRRRRWRRSPDLTLLVLATAVAGACVQVRRPAAAPPPLPAMPLAADSVRVDTVAAGVLHRFYYRREGPWAVHVLDVDRAACWAGVALKAGGGAVGRERTSTLLDRYSDTARFRSERVLVVGGVNADFFLFTPPGVPAGAHITGGRVIAGPSDRPVLAFDSAGAPWIGLLRARGTISWGTDSLPISRWNRAPAGGVAVFDRSWGPRLDTTTLGGPALVISDTVRGRLTAAFANGRFLLAPDSSATRSSSAVAGSSSIPTPPGGFVVALGADTVQREHWLNLLADSSVHDVRLHLEPFHPQEAVGGRPVILRDGQVPADMFRPADTTFGPVRHPRTAAGIAAGGRRLLLVVVDGRQPGYSAGMTLPELASLMRELGASDAVNLDGGGSSSLALRAVPGGLFRPANRPSDAAGERPVANALAIVRDCRRAWRPPPR
ncbi:MAG: phosphodiester glycosidase family protein [Gemmatimonadaceae bacterium]